MFGAIAFGPSVLGSAGSNAAAGALPTSGTSLSWTVLPTRNVCGVRRKHASAVRLFDFDFARLPEIEDGDVITSAELSQERIAGSGELTLGEITITGAKVKFAIADGTAWAMHRITCVVETALGRSLVAIAHLHIH